MATQALLTKWFNDRAAPRVPRTQTPPPVPTFVACLGGDGLALRPWLKRGYASLDADLRAAPQRATEIVASHTGCIAFACAFPPCVDLANAGARWWRRKRAANPNFQTEAIERLRSTELVLRSSGAPYCMFTPGSAMIRKLWKGPNAVISPYQYGGYLPEDHQHPTTPNVVPGRDRYHKHTYVFTGNGFVLPRRKPVVPVWVTKRHKKTGKLRRVSPVLAKRKYKHARRLAPLGFLQAVANLHAR